jgi:3-isopropylmalate/(R)-2-methylmalate dehydratase large subunit
VSFSPRGLTTTQQPEELVDAFHADAIATGIDSEGSRGPEPFRSRHFNKSKHEPPNDGVSPAANENTSGGATMGQTLAEKIWNEHLVRPGTADEPDLIYVDMHLVNEVTSPAAFSGLREAGRVVRRPDLTLAIEDHNTPTDDIFRSITDPAAALQLEHLRQNCQDFGIELYSLGDTARGIVHVTGPELGLTQPGMTVVCCDSHTSTHGAFGALAFGIGTSQGEHVLATQTLSMRSMKNMLVTVHGELPPGATAKDLILTVIEVLGTDGGQGHVIEYQGAAIRQLSMEGRMTVSNMSIEAGARAGLIAPDETTIEYLRGRPHVVDGPEFDIQADHWRTLVSDPDAHFDKQITIDATTIHPRVTWGTNPSQSVPLTGEVPDPADFAHHAEQLSAQRALGYMELQPGTKMSEVSVDAVFIGSCTNSRIEDLREVAAVWQGRTISPEIEVILVPGSDTVRAQAVREGLDQVFTAAGVDLRYSGCSMCVALNEDRVSAGKRIASTSNRNFEGRQGTGVKTHLVSPAVAAATAVTGRLTAPSELKESTNGTHR